MRQGTKTREWLSIWEREMDMDLGHLVSEKQITKIKIWVGNHIVRRYEDILADNNIEQVNDRSTILNKAK